LTKEKDNMTKKQFVVVGLGHFGASVATTLYRIGANVLAIDADAERVEEVRDMVTHAVQASGVNREALIQLGVRDFDIAVVAIGGDIKASCMATMLMKELGVGYIVAKAQDEIHGRMLSKLGADKVVYPERDMGKRVAHNLVSGNILDFIELSPDYFMVEVTPPVEWEGKSLSQLELRKRMGVNVIAIRRNGQVDASPKPASVILAGDRLLGMAEKDVIKELGHH
jgi:trk system potassium uptake protein TrkA